MQGEAFLGQTWTEPHRVNTHAVVLHVLICPQHLNAYKKSSFLFIKLYPILIPTSPKSKDCPSVTSIPNNRAFHLHRLKRTPLPSPPGTPNTRHTVLSSTKLDGCYHLIPQPLRNVGKDQQKEKKKNQKQTTQHI